MHQELYYTTTTSLCQKKNRNWNDQTENQSHIVNFLLIKNQRNCILEDKTPKKFYPMNHFEKCIVFVLLIILLLLFMHRIQHLLNFLPKTLLDCFSLPLLIQHSISQLRWFLFLLLLSFLINYHQKISSLKSISTTSRKKRR